MRQIFVDQDGLYIKAVTKSQLKTFNEFNERSKPENRQKFGGDCDDIQIVEDDDDRADMITHRWFGMTVGILPDGSAHS